MSRTYPVLPEDVLRAIHTTSLSPKNLVVYQQHIENVLDNVLDVCFSPDVLALKPIYSISVQKELVLDSIPAPQNISSENILGLAKTNYGNLILIKDDKE